ncbi:TetR family transcriptional regulator [Flindersiella endophytica]
MVASRRRGPRSDALRNDQRILEAAARVLADDPRATIQRIADEAGVVRLTVYRRYANRDALRRAIYEAAAEEASQAIQAASARELDALAALRELIVAMAGIVRRYPLLSVGTDLQPLPGEVRRPPVPPSSRAMRRAFVELIRRGQAEGSLRAGVRPELLAQAVVGTLRLASRFSRSTGSPGEELGAEVADLVLNGAATGRFVS